MASSPRFHINKQESEIKVLSSIQDKRWNSTFFDCMTQGISTKQEVEALAAQLKVEESIQRLNLAWNNLSEQLATLFAQWGEMDSLATLNLCNNQLTPKNVAAIIEILETHPKLQSLDLSWNALSGGVEQLAKAVRQHPNLKHLGLAFNELTEEEMRLLIEMLEGHASLETLDVAHNALEKAEEEKLYAEVHQKQAKVYQAQLETFLKGTADTTSAYHPYFSVLASTRSSDGKNGGWLQDIAELAGVSGQYRKFIKRKPRPF